jgi:hypothetical protein
MPIVDVTIDTNVLMHSCNPNENRCNVSIAFLSALVSSNCLLALDPGFTTDAGTNRSLIGGEYLEKLIPGSLPFAAIAHLAGSGRIKVVTSKVPANLGRKINQMISNRRDRTFLKVSLNSDDRTFASHDFADFSADKRKAIRKEFGVSIVEAQEATQLL